MTHALKVLAIALALILPASAFAATPSVSATVNDRTIEIRYKNLPGGELHLLNAKKEVVKEVRVRKGSGTKSIRLRPQLPAGSYDLVTFDRSEKEVARTSLTISYDKPTCVITPSAYRIQRGDQISFSWKSKNADRAVVFKKVLEETRGYERISFYHTGPHKFDVVVLGMGGVGSCSSRVFIEG